MWCDGARVSWKSQKWLCLFMLLYLGDSCNDYNVVHVCSSGSIKQQCQHIKWIHEDGQTTLIDDVRMDMHESTGTVQVKHAYYCNTMLFFFCTAQYIDNLVGNLYYFCNGKRPAGRHASRFYMLYIDLQQSVPGSKTISTTFFRELGPEYWSLTR